MSTKDLQAKVKELKELKIMASELADEIGSIEDEIKAEMLARDTDEIITGEYKIRYKLVESTRFDTTAFKKAHADIYNLFTKQTSTRRFTIA